MVKTYGFTTFLVLTIVITFILVNVQKNNSPLTSSKAVFDIHIVSDNDENSFDFEKGKCASAYWKGQLTLDNGKWDVSFPIANRHKLYADLTFKNRGAELSSLSFWQGAFYACDDRTGIVYRIIGANTTSPSLSARYILGDGDGQRAAPFKCEWSTVIDGDLYVGSFGKERAHPSSGLKVDEYPMWVKRITPKGAITSLDWRRNYDIMRAATNTLYPNGYLWHEGAEYYKGWWYFLPRRESYEHYHDVKDSVRGSNLALRVNFKTEKVETIRFDDLERGTAKGFSEFRFIPDYYPLVVALRTEEIFDDGTAAGEASKAGIIRSHISVLNVLTGEVVMSERLVGNEKFEGLEIIKRDN